MPRRKSPVRRRSEADQSDAEGCRPAIGEILRQTDRFKQLDAAKQRTIEDRLVDAVGFAKAGLSDILSGKHTRPAAWTMDIFVRDVCDAMKQIGLDVTMSPDPGTSRAQDLARKIAEAARLPDQGNLYKQMQRARDIEKRRLPDITIVVTTTPRRN